MLRQIAFLALLGTVLTGCAEDARTGKAADMARACIEAKGYRVSTDPDDRVAIQPSAQVDAFTIFFPSGHVADVAFQVIEGVTDEALTVPTTLSGFSAFNEDLNSVEDGAIKECNQKALAEVRD
jgi:hypothetical protein